MSDNYIEIKGLNGLEKKLNRLRELGRDTAPLMSQIAQSVKNQIEDSFNEQRDPWGKAWKPLASSTLEKKRRKGYSSKILRASGRLADGWLSKSDSLTAKVFATAKSKNGFPYGAVHQTGGAHAGRGRSTKIPARPFIPAKDGHLAPKTGEIVVQTTIDFIRKLLK